LKAGEAPFSLEYDGVVSANQLRWGDTAGAAADPLDPDAVWVADAHASDHRSYQRNNWALWVGKLSLRLPDCVGFELIEATALPARNGYALGAVTELPATGERWRLGRQFVVAQSVAPGSPAERGQR
jgi:hypothetical protein